MKKNPLPEEIAPLRERYEGLRPAIRARLAEFSAVNPSEYFHEMIYCLLTPQSSAVHADMAVARLRELHFAETGFDPEPVLREKLHYIRFHRTKARHLLKARDQFAAILPHVTNGSRPAELREWLVNNVTGLGYKEATHFLRNIGRNGGLAILDRHILRNLKRYGVVRSLPKSLSKKKYDSIERRFQRFAAEIGIPLDELDLLFWSMETGEIRK